MPAFDVLDALVRGGNGVLRTADAVAAGITRPVLGNYVRERDLERVGHGLYPVSYTHLDVYKRQSMYWANSVSMPDSPAS